jgi:DNA-binding MarR family transcriptional regulator
VAALFNSCVVQVEALKAQWRRVMDISAHERMALAQLWESGPMTMSQVGSSIGLSRAAVTSLIDRLEAAGYVERREDANDRRRTIVTHTDKAYSQVAPIASIHAIRLTEWVASMSDEEWDVIYRFLDAVGGTCKEEAARLRTFTDDEMRDGSAEVAGATGSLP